jgi:hypothetical protein
MRKLFLTLVMLLVVPTAAAARPGDKGDGTFAVKNAVGQITVVAKGTALGRVDEGQIAVADMNPGGTGDEIQVLGYDKKPYTKPNGTTVYRGVDMRFRIVGGWYSLTVTGTGVNVSAVGRGTVQGQGISEGLFSTDGLPFKPAPPALYAGSFGQQ